MSLIIYVSYFSSLTSFFSPYTTLGVADTLASNADIKKIARAIYLANHPDRNFGNEEEANNKVFQFFNISYCSILGNPNNMPQNRK
jgi:DnaJ-class molecular chaperone